MANNIHVADGKVHLHVYDCWPSNYEIHSHVFPKAEGDCDRLFVSVKVQGEISDYTSKLAMCVKVKGINIGDSSQELDWFKWIVIVKHEEIRDKVRVLAHDPAVELQVAAIKGCATVPEDGESNGRGVVTGA
jgi:hypothetical protein